MRHDMDDGDGGRATAREWLLFAGLLAVCAAACSLPELLAPLVDTWWKAMLLVVVPAVAAVAWLATRR